MLQRVLLITGVTIGLAFACTISLTAQKRQLFSGTVMGYDGKPMKDAHIEMWRYDWGDHWAGTVNIDVGTNGKFITKLHPGLYSIRFAGVDHAFSERKYLYIDSTMNCTVNARLERSSFLSLEALDTLFVRYEDPTGGSVDRRLQPMEYLGDGRFRAQLDLPGKTDPLRDLLEVPPALAYHIQGIVADRWVNGTDQDYYHYDGDGDFASVKRFEDSVMTVEFDYHALTASGQDVDGPEHRFHIDGDPLLHPYAMVVRRKRAYSGTGPGCGIPYADSGSAEYNYYIKQGIRPLALADTVGRFDDIQRQYQQQSDSASVYLAKIELAGDTIDPLRLESLLFLYLHAVRPYQVHEGRSSKNESAGEIREWVQRAMEVISPTSPIWCMGQNVHRAFRVCGEDTCYTYAERILRENPSPVAQYYAFEYLKSYLRHDKTDEGKQRLRELYQETQQLLKGTVAERSIELTDADPLAAARKKRDAMRQQRPMNIWLFNRWEVDSNTVGKPVPSFSFYKYKDSSQTYTNASFAGKPYILCIEYVNDIEHLFIKDMYERYADSGLQVVMAGAKVLRMTIKDTMRTIITKPPVPDDLELPWPMLQAEKDDLDRIRAELEAFGGYGHFLVDSDGIVVAAGPHMHEHAIELSVEKYFEGKLE